MFILLLPHYVENEIGGYYCYMPIPYAKSIKIVYKGNDLKFHQIQYRELSGKEKVKSFSWSYFDNTLLLPEIDKIWNCLPFLYMVIK